jgi:hypothetical protein
MRLLVALCLSATVLAGCTEPKASLSAAGAWQGSVGTQVLTATLAQDNAGSVTGTGTMTNTPSGTRALTITGAVADNSSSSTSMNISLTLTSGGTTTPFNLTGTVSESAIVGKLNGSGFTDDAIVLHKQ